jgi:hypothetical protein
MSESEDLAAQVESAPADYELRWRLAKRLYRTGDYREGLKHLQVLRGQWKPKINVARYLAATYYRLGRYDQSIAELEDAVAEWPGEIPLREQLARVFEVAGRKERAILTWKSLLDIKPDYEFAVQALERLENRTPPPVPSYVPTLNDEDMGLDAGTGFLCPNCGTLNTGESDRCWKCNTRVAKTPRPQRSSISEVPPRTSPMEVWHTLGGIAAGFLLLLALLLTLRQYFLNLHGADGLIPLETVQDVLNEKMWLTKLVLGGALVAGWPLAIWIAVTFARAYEVRPMTIFVTGGLFGAAMMAALWLPFYLLVVAAPLIILLTIVPICFLFPMDRIQKAVTSVVQAALVLCLSYIVVALLEGNVVVAAVPTLLNRSFNQDRVSSAGHHLFPPLTVPLNAHLKWNSTGSVWLDRRAGRSIFTISSSGGDTELTVEITDGENSVYYNRATKFPFKFAFEPQPERPYEFIVKGSEGTELEITISGVLMPRLEL